MRSSILLPRLGVGLNWHQIARGSVATSAHFSYVPVAPTVSEEQLQSLVHDIRSSKRVVVLTGISTESNIPDYRGPQGAYQTGFKPITHQQFMGKPERRARYFARSYYGWPEFSSVQHNAGHNAGHAALAQMQKQGWIQTIITQNVDRLHQSAGASDVLELHGTTYEVKCMACGSMSCRHELQRKIAHLNPEAAVELSTRSQYSDYKAWQKQLMDRAGTNANGSGDVAAVELSTRSQYSDYKAWQKQLMDRAGTNANGSGDVVPIRRPDGDTEVLDAGEGFQVPDCLVCGSGPLKPDVVFFGDNIPVKRAELAMELSSKADLFIAIGTSLMTLSAFRLAQAASQNGKLVILNVGETRADDKLPLEKLELVAGDVLPKLAAHPVLLKPRTPA
eukprot:gene9975-7853_t